MGQSLPTIPLATLAIGLVPSALVIYLMLRWSLEARRALWANARMLGQLLVVGYVLTYVFRAENPLVILAVIAVMILASAWIVMRSHRERRLDLYGVVLVAVATTGGPILVLVTQIILDLPRWFEPSFVVPLAGMIFATAMNTVSLAAERFEAERERVDFPTARRLALGAALIPQINSLFAVGLVSLPGMMTGQILSGVDPLIAARYQILVMCMLFGTGGLSAALYLTLRGVREASGV